MKMLVEPHVIHFACFRSITGSPGGSAGTESDCNAGDLGLIPGLGRSPGEGKGYPLQYSGLENSMENSMYSPWGRKESNMTVWLSLLGLRQHFKEKNRVGIMLKESGYT